MPHSIQTCLVATHIFWTKFHLEPQGKSSNFTNTAGRHDWLTTTFDLGILILGAEGGKAVVGWEGICEYLSNHYHMSSMYHHMSSSSPIIVIILILIMIMVMIHAYVCIFIYLYIDIYSHRNSKKETTQHVEKDHWHIGRSITLEGCYPLPQVARSPQDDALPGTTPLLHLQNYCLKDVCVPWFAFHMSPF